MQALAINGSPRKEWNTATLLRSVLEGAKEAGAETELINLYDLTYSGCISCFSCKKIGGRSYGRCAMKDELTPILEKVLNSDILILGSPLYFGAESGEMRSCMERILFPLLTYTPEKTSLYNGTARTAFIHTMNVKETEMAPLNQDWAVTHSRNLMERIFGNCESFICTDTYQFKDYSKYLSTAFDAKAKKVRHETVFPEDCERAKLLGNRLVKAG